MAFKSTRTPMIHYVNRYNSNGDIEQFRELIPVYQEFKKIMYDNKGSVRRNKLLKLFEDGLEIMVNEKHCLIIKRDSDIKRLLKQNKIEMFYDKYHPYDTFTRTFVRIKK